MRTPAATLAPPEFLAPKLLDSNRTLDLRETRRLIRVVLFRVGSQFRICSLLVAFVAAVVALAPGVAGATERALRDHLYDVDFVTPKLGWVVGAFGTIARTEDGGASWHREPSGTVENLFGVDFVDSEHGWAVGRAGTILSRGADGRWKKQESGTQRHFFQVAALDDHRVWVVGDWGAIFYTEDGGETWQDRSLPEDVILNDIFFLDGERGWIVGEFGSIFVTKDGGKTWERQESGVEKTLFGVFFADENRGWAVGLDNVLLRTEDGGGSWLLERGRATSGSLERMGFLEALTNPSLYAVEVVGDLGIVVGDMGTILVSRDGGRTWEREDVPDEWALRWIRALSLVPGSPAGGALVGSGGLTIPVDGGKLRYPDR
ncbi:MAG: hypothetical protein KatS3mg076_0795 [Candidatus Binatia bacterium]|nr:MAG: hypothetical protein KatS3mg076_0795 [Candidatus Binatia bacterium]